MFRDSRSEKRKLQHFSLQRMIILVASLYSTGAFALQYNVVPGDPRWSHGQDWSGGFGQINQRGDAVLIDQRGQVMRAFLLLGSGGAQRLPAPFGSERYAEAVALNGSGEVAMYWNDPFGAGVYSYFYDPNIGHRRLQAPIPGEVIPWDMNNQGDVIGNIGLGWNPWISHRGETAQMLPCNGPEATASRINDSGVIAGTEYDAKFGNRLAIWRDPEKPPQYVSPPPGMVLRGVEAISNTGEVAVLLYVQAMQRTRGFVWSEAHGFTDLGVVGPSWVTGLKPVRFSDNGVLVCKMANLTINGGIIGRTAIWSRETGPKNLASLLNVFPQPTFVDAWPPFPDGSMYVSSYESMGFWLASPSGKRR